MAYSWNSSSTSIVLHVGAVIGIFQGVAWTVLSFTAIILHFTNITMFVTLNQSSYQECLKAYMFYTFFKYNRGRTTKLIQPGEFFSVMCLYFILSLLWIGSSEYVLYGCRKNHHPSRIFYALAVWVGVGISTLLLDLIFCCVLGADYNTVSREYYKVNASEVRLAFSFSVTSYGIVMVLAARGFILWILNLFLTILMAKLCIQFKYSSETTYNDDIYNTVLTRSSTMRRNEKTPDRFLEELSRRQVTAAAVSSGVDTSSSFHFNRDLLYDYDPEVQRRLQNYIVTPEESLYRSSS